MDRRGFLRALRNGVSSSFILGSLGGIAIGAAGVYAYDRRDNTHFSYAQQGEDLIIEDVLREIHIEGPITYLDIGAYDPIYHSNTYLFYKAGGHGVLVEPNPSKVRRLEWVRPRDRTLNVGVGTTPERSTSDYYVIGGPSKGALNTFSKEEAEMLHRHSAGEHFIEKVVKLPLDNINTIIQQELGAAPTLLSIDTEGMDLDILKTLDFDRFRPDVICVETSKLPTNAIDLEILRFLESKHYSARGATFINTIFVDDRHLAEPGPLTAALRPKT
jgi:FkbM family methyltransferase